MPPSQARKPIDARVAAAELTVKQYCASKPTAAAAALRAYYIWHANEDLTPEAITRLLRDPPLKVNTVVSYILQAIVTEKLPYGRARLKAEVMAFLHPDAVNRRYRSLAKDCQGV